MIADLEDRREQDRHDPPRRGDLRRRCLLRGLLAEAGSDRVEAVGVRNLSDLGAKLDMGGLRPISSGAVLLIPSLNAAFELEVVWRRLPQAGVRFRRAYPVQEDVNLRSFMRIAS